MNLNLRPYLPMLVLLISGGRAGGQTVEFDYSTATRTQGGSIVVNQPLKAEVVVGNVNNILYDYQIKSLPTPKVINDFKALGSLLTPAMLRSNLATVCPVDEWDCIQAVLFPTNMAI